MFKYLLLFAFVGAVNAAPLPPMQNIKPPKPAIKFELDGVPVSQVLRVVFAEVVKTSYVLAPSVVSDQRQVSFRWDALKGDIRPFLMSFLDMLGYSMESVGGADFVGPKKETKETEADDKHPFIYRPKFRDGSYLVDLLGSMFKGKFTVQRSMAAPLGAQQPIGAVPSGSAAAMIERKADTLIFYSTPEEIEKLKSILAQVDTATGQVLVRGALYEVQSTKGEGSAFQLAANLLSGKLGVTLGGGGTAYGSSISSKFTGALSIDAVLSALNSDSHFKVVSSPSLRVRDGATAKLTVGEDVPVLGALSYPQGAGQAVQSVEYRSSGVLFNITPTIRDSIVDLNVHQQVSNFVKTQTGVNGSPTLTKRELNTSVSMEDGGLIVLGGLDEDKISNANSGLPFVPDFLRSHSEDSSKSEILLILQVTKI